MHYSLTINDNEPERYQVTGGGLVAWHSLCARMQAILDQWLQAQQADGADQSEAVERILDADYTRWAHKHKVELPYTLTLPPVLHLPEQVITVEEHVILSKDIVAGMLAGGKAAEDARSRFREAKRAAMSFAEVVRPEVPPGEPPTGAEPRRPIPSVTYTEVGGNLVMVVDTHMHTAEFEFGPNGMYRGIWCSGTDHTRRGKWTR